jgi:hypothetical protein
MYAYYAENNNNNNNNMICMWIRVKNAFNQNENIICSNPKAYGCYLNNTMDYFFFFPDKSTENV